MKIPCIGPETYPTRDPIAVLPNGYSFAEDVDVSDVYRLWEPYDSLTPGEWERCRRSDELAVDVKILDVGVQDASGSVVALGGMLLVTSYNELYAELHGLVVSRNAQHIGIGKAIVDIRMAAARAEGALHYYIYQTSTTNSLVDYYVEKHAFLLHDHGAPTLYKGKIATFA